MKPLNTTPSLNTKPAKNAGGTSSTDARQTGKPITPGAKTPGSKAIRLAQVLRRKGQAVQI